MWIVRLALRRPYTFVVLALLLLLLTPIVVSRTPTTAPTNARSSRCSILRPPTHTNYMDARSDASFSSAPKT